MTNLKRINADRPAMTGQAEVNFDDLEQPVQDQSAGQVAGLYSPDGVLRLDHETVTRTYKGQKIQLPRLNVKPTNAMSFGGSFALGFWLVTVLISPLIICVLAAVWQIVTMLAPSILR